MDKVDIKITLSGKRATGKTVMAVFLKSIFESLGAEVHLTGFDFEKPMARYYINKIEKKPKRFDKSRITIFEEMAKNEKDSYIKAYKHLRMFSMKQEDK